MHDFSGLFADRLNGTGGNINDHRVVDQTAFGNIPRYTRDHGLGHEVFQAFVAAHFEQFAFVVKKEASKIAAR